MIANELSTRASSSIAIAYASVSDPAPPHCSGSGMPSRPSSARLADELDREHALAVEPVRLRLDPALGEVAHGVAEQGVLVGQVEVERHQQSDSASSTSSRTP